MRAAIFAGPRLIEVGGRPDPVCEAPTDAVVRVVLGAVCGSDLWYYRGETPHALGPLIVPTSWPFEPWRLGTRPGGGSCKRRSSGP